MALKKITATDFKEAVDALTPYGEGQVVWLKELGRTDGGTGLYLIVGWTRELGYSPEEIEASGFVGDNDDYLAYKIGYFNYKPGIRYLLQDFDDFRMPHNLKDDKSHGIYAGDVWATDSYLPNEPAAWSRIADELTKDAQGIWDTWGENGELDLMESKKSESAKGSMRRKQESIQKKKESVLNSVYPVITSDDTLRYALLATTRIRKNDMVRIVPCIEYQGKLCQVYTGRVDDPVWYRAGRISDNEDLHNDKAFVAVVDTPQEALQEFRKLGNPGVTRIAMQSENRVYWDDVSDEGTIKVKNTAPFRNDYYDIEVPDNGTTINDGIDGSMGGNNWRATVYWKPKDAVTAAFKWLDNLMAQARKKGDSLVAQQSDHRSKGSAIKSRIATFQDDAD